MKKDAIKSADVNAPAIIGTYEGEVADSNITNLNGLDITREVWENVFNSDEYKQALELGWYIGYLGHPEDPNSMEFKDACIVMTDGWIDDNGKVYGKFNLVDTPVGQVVKKFQDAGVTFGISVRGAGDIINNSVDPETFVFRGFDLVSFPAFPESIPEFVAASTDTKKRAQYKAVCAAVKSNLDELPAESIDVLQSCFAEQSDEYKALEAKKQDLSDNEDECDEYMYADSQVEGLTDLYLKEHEKCKVLQSQNLELKKQLITANSRHRRELKAIRRITASQMTQMDKSIADISLSRKKAISAAKVETKEAIRANSELKTKISRLEKINLKYKHKIEANSRSIDNKEEIISSLQSQLDKTVVEADTNADKMSNLDNVISKLKAEITATTKLLSEYQDAYAALYSNAVGTSVGTISVTSSTSVSEMQKIIASTVSIPEESDTTQFDEIVIDDGDEDDLITM